MSAPSSPPTPPNDGIRGRAPYIAVQIGRTSTPAQVLQNGYPREMKMSTRNTSLKCYIYDEDTMERLMELENAVRQKYPQLKLNSCMSDVSEDGRKSVLIRMKCTRNEERYERRSPEAPPSLAELSYGALFLAKCNVQEWTYYDECGIVIYANLVQGVGTAESPQGEQVDNTIIHWD